jgi:hypothetical protein
VRLDAYRACSWREKRVVLDAFWRRRASAPAPPVAVYQYGWWAVASLSVIVLELALDLAVLAAKSSGWGWGAGGAMALGDLALAWAIYRLGVVARSARPSDSADGAVAPSP